MKSAPSLPAIGGMLAALAAIALTAWLVWAHVLRETPVAISGPTTTTMITDVSIGGPFVLVDHRGETVTDETYHGRYPLIFFGFAFCPDICPTELANIAATMELLGPLEKRVQPLMITVDPERDTPEILAGYVRAFHPRLIGLSGTPEQIAKVARAYRVYYAKSGGTGADDYLVDHSTFTYLMGPMGRFITVFRHGTAPEDMAKEIRRHITEGTATAH